MKLLMNKSGLISVRVKMDKSVGWPGSTLARKQFEHKTPEQLTEFEPLGTGTEGGECTHTFVQQLIRLIISGL